MPDTPATTEETRYSRATARFAKVIDPDSPIDTTCYMSTDGVDDDDEIMLPSGCDLGRFSKNGPLLLCHDYAKPVSYYPLPVGQVRWVKVRSSGLFGGLQFARGTEMGRDVKTLVDEDILRGVSIGFRPIESSPLTAAEAKTREDWKAAWDRTRGKILVHRKWKLLELSVVPIPCNEDALIQTLKVKGMARPEWVKAPAASRGRISMAGTDSTGSELPEPLNRETIAERFPEAFAKIEAYAQPDTVARMLTESAAVKGALLGDLRGDVLGGVVDRLTSCLKSYLWSLAWSDLKTATDTINLGKIETATQEFEEAVTIAFGGMEALRPTAKEIAERMHGPVNFMARSMSAAAKKAFGDTVEAAKTEIYKAAYSADPDRGAEPDPEDENEMDESDDETEPQVRRGDHVKCMKGEYKGVVGKCVSIHKGEMVPDVADDVMGTRAEPACKVKAYKARDDGHVPTDHHIGVKMKYLKTIDDLQPPKKKTAKGITIDSVKIDILPDEVRTDEQIKAQRIAEMKAAGPIVGEAIAKALFEQMTGVV